MRTIAQLTKSFHYPSEYRALGYSSASVNYVNEDELLAANVRNDRYLMKLSRIQKLALECYDPTHKTEASHEKMAFNIGQILAEAQL